MGKKTSIISEEDSRKLAREVSIEWGKRIFKDELETGEMWICPEDQSVSCSVDCKAPNKNGGCKYWIAHKCALLLKEKENDINNG